MPSFSSFGLGFVLGDSGFLKQAINKEKELRLENRYLASIFLKMTYFKVILLFVEPLTSAIQRIFSINATTKRKIERE